MPEDALKVPVSELRRLADVLLCHAETVAGDSIVLDADYFWSVPPGELYDVYSEPQELTIGQLSESWQHLRDLLMDQDGAVAYHLVWLADILRALGHQIPG